MTFFYLFAFLGGSVIIWSIVRGAIYVPTHQKALARMLDFAEPNARDVMVDLGAGDGRIVIAFAQHCKEAHGYEHNPLLVWWSRKSIALKKLTNAFIHTKNFWDVDFSAFHIVIIFGAPHIMKRLEEKLTREAKPGAKIISHLFALPTWTPIKHADGVYLYTPPS